MEIKLNQFIVAHRLRLKVFFCLYHRHPMIRARSHVQIARALCSSGTQRQLARTSPAAAGGSNWTNVRDVAMFHHIVLMILKPLVYFIAIDLVFFSIFDVEKLRHRKKPNHPLGKGEQTLQYLWALTVLCLTTLLALPRTHDLHTHTNTKHNGCICSASVTPVD